MLLPQWQTNTPTRGSSARNVALRRIFRFARQCPARRSDQRARRARRAAGLDDGFGNVLGLAERPGHVNSRAAALQRIEQRRMAESVIIQLDAEIAPQLLDLVAHLHADREHDEIKFLFGNRSARARPPASGLRPLISKVSEAEIARRGILLERRNARAMILDAVFGLRAVIIFLVALAERARVHKEHVALECVAFGFGVLERHDGFFGGVHAAHRRAVIVRLIAAAHALQERNLFRRLVIGRAPDVTLRWPGRGQQPFELQRRDDVRVAPQPILLRERRVVSFVAGRQDDRADLYLLGAFEHVVINRVDAALVIAREALGAHAARQAARGFGLSFLVGVSLAHFVK